MEILKKRVCPNKPEQTLFKLDSIRILLNPEFINTNRVILLTRIQQG